MTEEFLIRRARAGDAVTIAQFNAAMALETEDKQLPEAVILAGVRGLMSRPEYGFYVVAERDGAICGSLMVTYEWSDWRNGVFWWIQSLYIEPEFRRQGVYRQMETYLRQLAREMSGVCGLRLYVEQNNRTARETYEALGMEECPYRMYEVLF